MKRKPGTSMEQLIDYYENKHSVLGVKIWNETGKHPNRYFRRYFHPMTFGRDPAPDEAPELQFDLATELWFDSREDSDEFFRLGSAAPYGEILAKDEMEFLDRDKSLMVVLEEYETDLSICQTN
ncbi:EthD domain-containing protein [Sphingobium tyrosinilyticum]|uniref:EthD domain-containing protein n=1 Tax=Sphingobium tyrosinilyticum TaxID=2715436 RepID=A0ABV9F3P7_9SPHN